MISDDWGVLSFDEQLRLKPGEFAEYLTYRRWLFDHKPREQVGDVSYPFTDFPDMRRLVKGVDANGAWWTSYELAAPAAGKETT